MHFCFHINVKATAGTKVQVGQSWLQHFFEFHAKSHVGVRGQSKRCKSNPESRPSFQKCSALSFSWSCDYIMGPVFCTLKLHYSVVQCCECAINWSYLLIRHFLLIIQGSLSSLSLLLWLRYPT